MPGTPGISPLLFFIWRLYTTCEHHDLDQDVVKCFKLLEFYFEHGEHPVTNCKPHVHSLPNAGFAEDLTRPLSSNGRRPAPTTVVNPLSGSATAFGDLPKAMISTEDSEPTLNQLSLTMTTLDHYRVNHMASPRRMVEVDEHLPLVAYSMPEFFSGTRASLGGVYRFATYLVASQISGESNSFIAFSGMYGPNILFG